jgi:large subunit ribosomal protein L5
VAEEKKKQADVEAKVEAEAEVKEEAKAEAKPETKAEGKPKAEAKPKGEKQKGEAKPKGEKAKAKGKKAKGKEAKGGEEKDKEAKGKKEAKPARPKGPADFELKYRDECIPALMEQFKYTNRMQVPRLSKIVVNTCIKEALVDIKMLDTVAAEIGQITGQRPVITKAKKSIANFKLRQGQSIGASVTLRGRNMWEFLSRLVNVALPRVRDFKGVPSKSFDGRGNYTLGITEQAIFPEINVDKIAKTNGMNITFVTTAETNEEGRALLKNMGMPFRTQ